MAGPTDTRRVLSDRWVKSIHRRRAEQFLLAGNLAAAIDEFKAAIKADGFDVATANALGDLYIRTGLVADALACFAQVADHYRREGFTRQHLAMLKKISRLDPDNPDIHIEIGDLLARESLLVEARQYYRSVADHHSAHGHLGKAVEACQKAAALGPVDGTLLLKLGELYLTQGLLETAHATFISARRESLSLGRMQMAQAAAMRARAIELGRGPAPEPIDRDRRRDERHALRLPTIVFPQNGKWQEQAGTLDVSKSGLQLSLVHPLEWGAIIRLELPMPRELRAAISEDPIYAIHAIVCHIRQTGTGFYVVGAEFGGKPQESVE
jgi:tetratricopeptide (TPR) repeat protein